MTDAPDSDAALRPSPFPWPPVLFLSSLAAAWALGRAYPLGWPGLDDTPARIIGIGFGVVGLTFILWAAWTMRAARTTILPHKRADHLVTSGPFRLRRNPIYLGEVFLMLGAAELSKNVWFVILVPVFIALVTVLAILPEERHLEARFGDAWRAYKAKTRRWI